MNELASQKRLLVAESELNRRALRLHCSDIEGGLDRARRFAQMGRAASPLLLVAVSVGAFFVVSKRKTLTGFVGKALSSWQLLQTLKPLWAGFMESRNSTAAAATELSSTPVQPGDEHE